MISVYFRSGFIPFSWMWWKNYIKPRNWFRPVLWLYQRATRGYADCDLWSLDSYLAQIMPGALEDLRKTKQGIPHDVTEEQFDRMLGQMAEGFRAAGRILDGHPYSPKHSVEYEAWAKEQQDLFDEGLRLFHERYFNLWD